MRNLFSVGIKSQDEVKLSKEQEKELENEGFIQRLPPKRDAIFKIGDVKNMIQVEKVDEKTGVYQNNLYYCLREDDATFYRIQMILSWSEIINVS